MKKFYFDFETRSKLDLKKVGRKNYFEHPSTETTLLTYAIDDGPIKHWFHDQPLPRDLIDILNDETPYYKVAHNISFDIECVKLFVEYQFVLLDLSDHWWDKSTWIDTMSLTDEKRFGSSLDAVSRYLGIDTKDKIGKAAMVKQSKPNKEGNFPILNEEEEKAFIRYGEHDVRVCREILKALPDPLGPFEKGLWDVTYAQNQRGIPIDKPLVELMEEIVIEQGTKLTKRFHEIFQGKYNTIGSPKLKEFFQRYYPYCDNLQAETVEKMWLDDRKVPALVREVLAIKKASSSSSVAKVKKILDVECDGVVYDNLHYHRDHNKRWASHGIQVQNFPRSVYEEGDLDFKDPDFTKNAIIEHEINGLDIQWVKNNLRRVFKAPGFKKIYCADLSKIEPTVMFWLLGIGEVPVNWYEKQAGVIYGKSPQEIDKDGEERQLGKTACLSCGYGAGAVKFHGICRKAGINISESMAMTAVKSYRQLHPKVTKAWRDLETCFKQAFTLGDANWEGKVFFRREDNIDEQSYDIVMTLPGGSELYYRRVKINGDITYLNPNKARTNLWGGTLLEHVVSALARDLLGHGLIRLEKAGYETICSIHDEIWVLEETIKHRPMPESGDLSIEEKINPPMYTYGKDGIIKEIAELMTKTPAWAKDLKLAVDVKAEQRYSK